MISVIQFQTLRPLRKMTSLNQTARRTTLVLRLRKGMKLLPNAKPQKKRKVFMIL